MATGRGVKPLPGAGADGGVGPVTGTAEAKQAVAWGTAAGKALGKVKNAPHITVGYLDILAGIESATRVENTVRQALKAVGYKMLYCNGAGTPAGWNTCGHTLLAEGAKAIIESSIDPSSIPTVLQEAKAKNVPIIETGGAVPTGLSAAFYPNDAEAGRILAEGLLAKLGTGSGEIAVETYPTPWGQERTQQIENAIKGTKLKIVATTVTDPSNLVAGTQKWVTDVLTAYPNLKAFWFTFDSPGQVGADVVATRYPGKSYPNAPGVFTFHADPATQVLMRKGAVTEVVDVNYDLASWEAVNALAEYEARHTPLPGNQEDPSYPGIGDPYSYQLVTKATLPPPGDYVAPRKDGVSYFLAKWKAEGLGK